MINSNSKLAKQFWGEGKLFECPVIDFHAHMGELGVGYLPNKDPEDMLKTMFRCNTILACFCGHEVLFNPCFGEEKDIQTVKKYNDKFKAYHAVVSGFLDPKNDILEIEENSDIFIGFKFLCDYYKVKLTDPSHEPYWRYADKNRLLVLSHTWGGSEFNGLDQIEEILNQYKNIVFIAGHSLHNSWEQAAKLAKKYDNLYLELTAVLDDRGPLDYFIETIGSEKLLFGTDLPWFSTHHGIGAVLSAEMSDEDRKNIFYRNGVKILKRFPWFHDLWQRYGNDDQII